MCLFIARKMCTPFSKKFKYDNSAGQQAEPLDSPDDKQQAEDDQIQCSLPLYLDHWFGNKLVSHSSSPAAAASHSPSPGPSAPILDSQGFLFTGKAVPNSECDHSENRSPNLIHLSSLPHVEECPEAEDGREKKHQPELSPLLFTSPDPDGRDTSNCLNIKPDSSDSTMNTKLPPVVDTVTVTHKTHERVSTSDKSVKKAGKKRRRSLAGPSKEDAVYTCPPVATTLKSCSHKQGSAVSLLAIVLQVNPVMDVACRAGDKAGQTVPMSSLLLADPTKSYFKLSLWRQAASWVERISAGDVIYFRRIRLKMWRREVVGTTTMFSSVLNLHQPKGPLPPQVSSEIPEESVSALLQWAKQFFGYLFRDSNVPKSQRTVQFVNSDQLSSHPLVHFRGRLLTMATDKVVVVADSPDRELYLYLVGVNASLWSSQLHDGVGRVWEFMFLATSPDSLTQGGCTLHTTSRSQLRLLASDCQVSADLLKLFPSEAPGVVTSGQSVAHVLFNKSSGVYRLRARAERVEFIDGANLSLEHLCSLSVSSLVQELCQSCIFVGCGRCSKPLTQDENGIYTQCLTCLLSRPGDQGPSFRHYYRMLAVTLRDESGSGVLMVTHSVSPKVVGMEPVEIVRVSLSDSKEKLSMVKEALWRQLSCLKECEGVWTVSLGVTKDENSFVHTITASAMDRSCDSHLLT